MLQTRSLVILLSAAPQTPSQLMSFLELGECLFPTPQWPPLLASA